MYNAEGSFARKQLEKHGWTEGTGLGVSQQGISQAVKVHIKHDTTGVGHDPAKEFSDHWWDHAFNKAAANLTVETSEDGVVVKKKKVTQKDRSDAAKKALYGNFIKSSLLSNGTETKMEKEGGEESDSSEDDAKPKIHTLMLPDEELFRICEGRTAHKGARHGLKLNGKLMRIQEQERHLNEKNGDLSAPAFQPLQQPATKPASPSPAEEPSQTKRHKKCKKRKREEDHEESSPLQVCVEEEVNDSSDSKKKKKKKKERAESENEEPKKRRKEAKEEKGNEVDGLVPESDSRIRVCEKEADIMEQPEASTTSSKKKKKKKKQKERDEEENLERKNEKEENTIEASLVHPQSSGSSPVIEDDISEGKKRKKKSKTKSIEVSSDVSSEVNTQVGCDEIGSGMTAQADMEPSTSRKKSKKKKKSKDWE